MRLFQFDISGWLLSILSKTKQLKLQQKQQIQQHTDFCTGEELRCKIFSMLGEMRRREEARLRKVDLLLQNELRRRANYKLRLNAGLVHRRNTLVAQRRQNKRKSRRIQHK